MQQQVMKPNPGKQKKGRKERWKEETAGELIDKPTEPKQEIC